jgi:hypothetical protein
MIYSTTYISRKNNTQGGGTFFMRFLNTTGSSVTVNTLNNLFNSSTGSPSLQTAIVERAGDVINDVKGSGNSILNFTVDNGESCVFRMSYIGGVFGLQGTNNNSYKDIVRSAGYVIEGDWDVPISFMGALFSNCVNYNQQSGDVFNTTNWHPTKIETGFLGNTWGGCQSLTNAVVPDTTNWPITSIGSYFLSGTWLDCILLTSAVVPNTVNWNINTSILDSFLYHTWDGCERLVNPAVPNTNNWKVGSIGQFLSGTWRRCSLLTNPIVPNTANFDVSTITTYFLFQTWALCSSLTTPVVPNTTNWPVTGSIGSHFMGETWTNCSIVNGISPNTTNWRPTSIDSIYMRRTWYYNTSLRTCFLPDASNWGILSIIPVFLQGTWANSFSTTYASTNNVTCKGSIYSGNLIPLAEDSAGLLDNRIANVKVDQTLIPTYQSSSSWTYITDSKFISW